jgi:hypothetical protein
MGLEVFTRWVKAGFRMRAWLTKSGNHRRTAKIARR